MSVLVASVGYVHKGVALFVEWKLSSAPTGNRLADAHTFSFESVAALYDHQDPRQRNTYERRANAIASQFGLLEREQLVHTLRGYLRHIGASQAAVQNAERLLQPNSVAVVTGQQAGLFGGPLYSIYKAISAVGIAARLESELGRPVIPVFWIASEDHDWAEVNHAYVMDPSDEVRRIRLQTVTDPHQMVYHTQLDQQTVNLALRDLREAVGDGPYLAEMLSALHDGYEDGATLSQWFATLLARWTRDMGLVILDPCLPGIRKLAAPVWQAVLTEQDRISQHLAAAYAEVDEFGFTPEVIRDERNSTLFYVQDGQRYVLERTGADRLRARSIQIERSVNEWLDIAAAEPTAFSSNVLCRPVVQDHILPTLAYIGGPSEVAYHPLSRGVFHALGRTLPPLLLRQRVTLLPASVRRHMEKWHVSVESVIEPLDLVAPMLQQHGGGELDALFRVLGAEAEGRWRGLAGQFESYGPQVADIVDRQLRRELSNMQRARRKLNRLIELRHEDSIRQLRHIERWLWTDGHLQERRLSLLPFWAKYGVDWISDLPRWSGYDQPGAVYLVNV